MKCLFLRIILISLLLVVYSQDAKSQNNSKFTALTNARVIDGTGSEPKENWDILIDRESIRELGPNLEIPEDARVIDLDGKTVLPGLINMHGHIFVPLAGGNQPAYLPLFLAGGVTTIYSPGEFYTDSTLVLKREIENGNRPGPHILTAGPYFDHSSSQYSWIGGSKSLDGIRSQFNKWKDVISGAKVYTSIQEDQLKLLIELANKEDIPVTGHLGSITANRAIDLGIDGLEHGIFGMPEFYDGYTDTTSFACRKKSLNVDSPKVNSLIQKIVDKDVYITPTTVTFKAMQKDFTPVTPDWKDYLTESALMRYQAMKNNIATNTGIQSCAANAISKQDVLLKEIYERGGRIVTGTDPVAPNITPGYGIHREMKLLVDAGLPPMTAIHAATSNAAKALRKFDQFGSIEIGKEADLLVVDGNPAQEITDIGKTVMVFSNGQQYFPKKLRESAVGAIGK